jgi:hypothetical protein
MKRFHIHLHVQELGKNVDFYSKLFGTEPARVESDYAKWMLTDPPVNFAISTRGNGDVGLDHLGIQTDSAEELTELKARADSAELAPRNDGVSTCCYARSDKHWITDPQGIAWEHFQTLGGIPVFREEPASDTTAEPANACCAPKAPQGKASASSCC